MYGDGYVGGGQQIAVRGYGDDAVAGGLQLAHRVQGGYRGTGSGQGPSLRNLSGGKDDYAICSEFVQHGTKMCWDRYGHAVGGRGVVRFEDDGADAIESTVSAGVHWYDAVACEAAGERRGERFPAQAGRGGNADEEQPGRAGQASSQCQHASGDQ
jgi:hypothetical protein